MSGVKGSGKTTIIKAMLIAMTICSASYCIVYHDYKVHGVKSLVAIVREVCYHLDHDDYTTVAPHIDDSYSKDCISMLEQVQRAHGFWMGFALEELQEVYERAPSTLKDLNSIEIYASYIPKGFVIVSGSTYDLIPVLKMREPIRCNGCIVGFKRSLFYSIDLPVYRKIYHLRAYVRDRHGIEESDEWVQRLLYNTGGIGRYVDSVIIEPGVSLSAIEDNYNRVAALYKDKTSGLSVIVNLIMSSNAEMMDELRQCLQGGTSTFDKTLGVKMFVVSGELEEMKHIDHRALVAKLVECGALYIHKGSMTFTDKIEMIVPSYLLRLLNIKQS